MQNAEIIKNVAYGNKKADKKEEKKSEAPRTLTSSKKDNPNRRPAKEFLVVKACKVCVRCLKPGHFPGKNQPDSCKNNPPATMSSEWLALSSETRATVEEGNYTDSKAGKA